MEKQVSLILIDPLTPDQYMKYIVDLEPKFKKVIYLKTTDECVAFLSNNLPEQSSNYLQDNDEFILLIHYGLGKKSNLGYGKVQLKMKSSNTLKVTYMTSIPKGDKLYKKVQEGGEFVLIPFDDTIEEDFFTNYSHLIQIRKNIKIHRIGTAKDYGNSENLKDDNSEINRTDVVVNEIYPILEPYLNNLENGLYEDFKKYIQFLRSTSSSHWLDSLLQKSNLVYSNVTFYKNLYWQFETGFFDTYFSLTDSPFEVNTDLTGPNVHYDNKKWFINIRLIKAFIGVYTFDVKFLTFFESRISYDISNNLISPLIQEKYINFKRLLRLFILHESLHKIHNIDQYSVNGIGYHPRIIEEADYQADVYAIISEFFYSFTNNKRNFKTKDQIITLFIEIIEVAINTTMSFAGSVRLRSIQVRRFQRYSIWIFVMALIQQIRTNSNVITREQTIFYILDILSCKPILDIYGLTTTLEEDRNSSDPKKYPKLYCYDLHIKDYDKIRIAYFHKNFVEKRTINSEKVKELIDGIRESDISKIRVFIASIQSVIHLYR